MSATMGNAVAMLRQKSGYGLAVCLEAVKRAGLTVSIEELCIVARVIALENGRKIQMEASMADLKHGLVCVTSTDKHHSLFRMKCKTDFAVRSVEFGSLAKTVGTGICNQITYDDDVLESVSKMKEPISIEIISRWYSNINESNGHYVYSPHESNSNAGQRAAFISLQKASQATFKNADILSEIAKLAVTKKISSVSDLQTSPISIASFGLYSSVAKLFDSAFGTNWRILQFYNVSL